MSNTKTLAQVQAPPEKVRMARGMTAAKSNGKASLD